MYGITAGLLLQLGEGSRQLRSDDYISRAAAIQRSLSAPHYKLLIDGKAFNELRVIRCIFISNSCNSCNTTTTTITTKSTNGETGQQ